MHLSTYLVVNESLFGVIHDSRRVDWEVAHTLVLMSISHVDLTPLSLPEVGHSSGPHSRLNNYNAVLSGAVQRVAHCVGHFVTVRAKDPGGVVALAGLVLADGLQPTLVWVIFNQAVDLSITVFNFIENGVACLVVV